MREIIEKRVYDTDTAERIFTYENDCILSDPMFYQETLYRTADGRYFLYGEGGSMSKYAVFIGDGFTYGGFIVPISDWEAKYWIKDYIKK